MSKFKIIVLGNEDANISSFFGHSSRSKIDYTSNLGINIYSRMVIHENKEFTEVIWHLKDTPDEKSKKAREMFIMGADAVILFFNGDDPSALDNLNPYLNQIREKFSSNIIKVLIGNMVNVEGRKISFEEVRKLAINEGYLYAEKYKYDIDMILLAINYLRNDIPLSKTYKNLFCDTFDVKERKMLKLERKIESEEVKKLDTWKEDWKNLWKHIKKDEISLIKQRLNHLESDTTQFISDFYTSKRIISPIFESKQIFNLESTRFPVLLENCAKNEPNKLTAIKKFIRNEDDIHTEYWKEFYNLHLSMISDKITILTNFQKELSKIIETNEKLKFKLKNKLKDDKTPIRFNLDIADNQRIIETIIDKSENKNKNN